MHRILATGFLVSLLCLLVGCSASSPSEDAADGEPQNAPQPVPLKPTQDEQTDKPLIVKAPGKTPPGMVWIPGGEFTMGDRGGAPDKNPKYADVVPEHHDSRYEHTVKLDGYWMDATEVTNRQFKAFVEATGHVTTAERAIDLKKLFAQTGAKLPKDKKRFKKACSVCFNSKIDLSKVDKSKQQNPAWIYESKIWTFVDGANWRQPEGPGSSIEDRMDHPVVHVSWDDAVAYCKWAGKQLPTEAQWEYAARGGLRHRKYPWGNELQPQGKWYANIWQGKFPHENTLEDGFQATAPVKSFPANGYGLHDMAGNVWEWCADWYDPAYYPKSPKRNPQGPSSGIDPADGQPKRVQRGGSFMCSDNYCIGYSVAARMKGEPETGAFHTGFRCVVNADRLDECRNAPARKVEAER